MLSVWLWVSDWDSVEDVVVVVVVSVVVSVVVEVVVSVRNVEDWLSCGCWPRQDFTPSTRAKSKMVAAMKRRILPFPLPKLPNTRWYSGAGIYRNVTLRLGNKTHLASHPLKIKVVNYKPAKICAAPLVSIY